MVPVHVLLPLQVVSGVNGVPTELMALIMAAAAQPLASLV